MTDEAETFLRLIAEAELRGAIEPGSAESGLRRLEIIADTLTKVGQLEPEVAESVVACQELALAARGKIDGDPHRYRTVGRPARIRLLTLVLAPDRTVLTLTATRPDPRPDDAFEILWPATASDSRGARYRTRFAEFGGAISHLELEPPVRPGPHWLEVTFQPGTTPYRISLTASAAPPVQFTSEPSERRVERYLDSVTEQLLRPIRRCAGWSPSPGASGYGSRPTWPRWRTPTCCRPGPACWTTPVRGTAPTDSCRSRPCCLNWMARAG